MEKNWLEKFLPTLIKYSQEATIFIADNASTDDSNDFTKKYFPQVEIIVNKTNEGYNKDIMMH